MLFLFIIYLEVMNVPQNCAGFVKLFLFVIFEKCNPIAVADALSRSSTPQEVFPKQSLGHSAVTESRAPIG